MKKKRNRQMENFQIRICFVAGLIDFFVGILLTILHAKYSWLVLILGALTLLFRESLKMNQEELDERETAQKKIEEKERIVKVELSKEQLPKEKFSKEQLPKARLEEEQLAEERLRKIDEKLAKLEQERQERRRQEFKECIQTLNELPMAQITISETPAPTPDLEPLYDIKFSNITKRTSYQKLGNFVVIDVETTGLSPERDAIIEIAAIRFVDFEPVEKFVTLTSPKRHIPKSATRVNGITDEMVSGFPHFRYIAKSLESFIGKENIVGHNLEFDLKFIVNNGVNVFSCSRRYYDTLAIAQRTLKAPKRRWDPDSESYEKDYDDDYDVENHKLGTLCEYYDIPLVGAHRSLADCFAAAYLLKNLALARC